LRGVQLVHRRGGQHDAAVGGDVEAEREAR
jgi:hypothetical protein